MSNAPQPTTNPMDLRTFVELLRRSQLINADQWKAVQAKLPKVDRARTLARWMVENHLLTRFQAERLLAGRSDGFILGQYRILDQLGRGGMGRVFKAEQVMMGRVVALKILSSHLTNTPRARHLFDREVRAAAKLHHPNIVTAYDANEINDRCFLVMEFVDGPNLQDLVKQKGPLPITQACDFIQQAALGLQAAHDMGMVHRDVKPANLLVTKNSGRNPSSQYTVKILDFGLARLSQQSDSLDGTSDTIVPTKGTVMGTPDYLSPEQARSMQATNHLSDLYSLGCTMYFLLTGQVPFPGGAALDKMVRHATESPKNVREIRPDIPEDVEAVVNKLLSKNPNERFASATQLADVLEQILQQEAEEWIVIEALPQNEELASTSMIQRPSSSGRMQRDSADPWANLADRMETTGETPTLSGQSSKTKANTPYPLPAVPPEKFSWLSIVRSRIFAGAMVALLFLISLVIVIFRLG